MKKSATKELAWQALPADSKNELTQKLLAYLRAEKAALYEPSSGEQDDVMAAHGLAAQAVCMAAGAGSGTSYPRIARYTQTPSGATILLQHAQRHANPSPDDEHLQQQDIHSPNVDEILTRIVTIYSAASEVAQQQIDPDQSIQKR